MGNLGKSQFYKQGSQSKTKTIKASEINVSAATLDGHLVPQRSIQHHVITF